MLGNEVEADHGDRHGHKHANEAHDDAHVADQADHQCGERGGDQVGLHQRPGALEGVDAVLLALGNKVQRQGEERQDQQSGNDTEHHADADDDSAQQSGDQRRHEVIESLEDVADFGLFSAVFLFQGATTNELLWLVGLAVVNSFISLYYYLMVIRQMYLFDPVAGMTRFKISPVMWVLSAGLMLGVLFIGIYPGPAFKAAENAAKPLFQQAEPAGAARAP